VALFSTLQPPPWRRPLSFVWTFLDPGEHPFPHTFLVVGKATTLSRGKRSFTDEYVAPCTFLVWGMDPEEQQEPLEGMAGGSGVQQHRNAGAPVETGWRHGKALRPAGRVVGMLHI
jgi:hypothetical protein